MGLNTQHNRQQRALQNALGTAVAQAFAAQDLSKLGLNGPSTQNVQEAPVVWTCTNCNTPHNNPNKVKCRECGMRRKKGQVQQPKTANNANLQKDQSAT
eukprot:8994419-Karenia_brevis.AAC.1